MAQRHSDVCVLICWLFCRSSGPYRLVPSTRQTCFTAPASLSSTHSSTVLRRIRGQDRTAILTKETRPVYLLARESE